jgi:hypothetical protein
MRKWTSSPETLVSGSPELHDRHLTMWHVSRGCSHADLDPDLTHPDANPSPDHESCTNTNVTNSPVPLLGEHRRGEEEAEALKRMH